MTFPFARQISRIAIASLTLTMASTAYAQHIRRITTFATGTAVNATQPDSITLSRNSVWVEYGNGQTAPASAGAARSCSTN